MGEVHIADEAAHVERLVGDRGPIPAAALVDAMRLPDEPRDDESEAGVA